MVDLLVAGWPVEQVILFGSRARHEEDEDSDYDLLVVVRDEDYYKGIALDMRRRLSPVPVAKDLVVTKRSTLERQGAIAGTIYYEARQDGITLYAAA
jgi:predicted nucleotidyltransferase